MTATTTEPCSAHSSHSPGYTYCELHHVIPQAWQAFWQPPQPWPNQGPSPDRTGLVLFDARHVPLCRTGHGNVHYWLVKAMHAYEATPGTDGSDARIAAAWTAAKAAANGVPFGRADTAIAREAMTRWRDAGGSLDALVAARLWGEI